MILRHAHRNKLPNAAADNGLSQIGKKQALAIETHFRKIFPSSVRVLFASSPKLRCVETIQPLADGFPIEIWKDLDEGGGLLSKAKALFDSLKQVDAEVVVICSHGDVIPVVGEVICGIPLSLEKGGWARLDNTGKKWKVTELIQEF